MIDINKIYNENNVVTMAKIDDGVIDGIITSPPYNVATKRHDNYYKNGYDDIDGLTEEEFINTRFNEFKEFDRILTPKGVICYTISYNILTPTLPLRLIIKVTDDTNLRLVDMISWKKSNSMPFESSSNRLSRIVEQVYVFAHKDHFKNFTANKTVAKINERTKQKFYKYYNNFIEAKNNDRLKSNLKASYSEEFVEKLLDIYFSIDSLIYDPFSGIGTTARACIKKQRRFIASELKGEFYDDSIKYRSEEHTSELQSPDHVVCRLLL